MPCPNSHIHPVRACAPHTGSASSEHLYTVYKNTEPPTVSEPKTFQMHVSSLLSHGVCVQLPVLSQALCPSQPRSTWPSRSHGLRVSSGGRRGHFIVNSASKSPMPLTQVSLDMYFGRSWSPRLGCCTSPMRSGVSHRNSCNSAPEQLLQRPHVGIRLGH